MRTDLRLAIIGVLAGALLVGCASESTPNDSSPKQANASGAAPTGGAAGTVTPTPSPPGSKQSPSGGTPSPSGGAPSPSGTAPSTQATPESGSPSPSPSETSTAGVEMPVAPEPSVTSLSDLLPAQNTGPLVTAPLPGAASARGRLVSHFPAFLRPARASTIESSSLSPEDSRLQVALVGSTSLSAAAVLNAYRVRLAARGLAEGAAPHAVGGSQAASFRRGLSRVTIVVTAEGPRTSYSIHAVLHAGRE